ncbi:MAG: hypothetical protein ABI939_04060 [Anaerolineaceae bacterium]
MLTLCPGPSCDCEGCTALAGVVSRRGEAICARCEHVILAADAFLAAQE